MERFMKEDLAFNHRWRPAWRPLQWAYHSCSWQDSPHDYQLQTWNGTRTL